jgi:hypothetical protein
LKIVHRVHRYSIERRWHLVGRSLSSLEQQFEGGRNDPIHRHLQDAVRFFGTAEL